MASRAGISTSGLEFDEAALGNSGEIVGTDTIADIIDPASEAQ